MKNTIWALDQAHSEVFFKIKHLVISTVTGSFKKFDGRVITEGKNFDNADVSFTIDVKSIDTNQPQRDEHLQNGDFFSSDIFPFITFQSTSFVNKGGDNYKIIGNLTLRGVTKSIELDAVYGGVGKDMYGNVKHGFEITGIINRPEFGMTWNVITDTGGLGLGENVKLIANIQIIELEETIAALED